MLEMVILYYNNITIQMAQTDSQKTLKFNFLPNVTQYQCSLGGSLYDCSLNDLVFGALLKYNFYQNDYSENFRLVTSSLVNRELFTSKFPTYLSTVKGEFLDLKSFFEGYDAFFAKCMKLDQEVNFGRLSDLIDCMFFNKFKYSGVNKKVYFTGVPGAKKTAKFCSIDEFVGAFYKRVIMWGEVLSSKDGWHGASWDSLYTLKDLVYAYIDTFPEPIVEKIQLVKKTKKVEQEDREAQVDDEDVQDEESDSEDEYDRTYVDVEQEVEQLTKTLQMVMRLANDFKKRDKEARDKLFAEKKERYAKIAKNPEETRKETRPRKNKGRN